MPAVKITENIYWVGAVDWDVREFHGYKVPFGTSYNAYLVIDDKISLIDTVKAQFFSVMLDNIKEICDPASIDYLISNHSEPDHSGSLPFIADIAKNAKVIASPNGDKILTAYYKRNFNVKTVKTGDTLNTGKYDFNFTLTPMVHWPDNMVTYLPQKKILFSNDSFGQHQATNERFDDQVGYDTMISRARDYYANIVLPFGVQVKKELAETANLSFDFIAPSHGLIWRTFIGDIAAKYTDWSANKVDEKLAVLVYDTMWGTTAELGQQIAAEFAQQGITTRIMPLTEYHVSQCMDALLEAKYIGVGSPTLNRNIMPRVAGFLAYLKGLSPKGRTGIAFGSYGWSGESVGIIEQELKNCSFELLPSKKAHYRI
jgi:flavorubredoxin